MRSKKPVKLAASVIDVAAPLEPRPAVRPMARSSNAVKRDIAELVKQQNARIFPKGIPEFEMRFGPTDFAEMELRTAALCEKLFGRKPNLLNEVAFVIIKFLDPHKVFEDVHQGMGYCARICRYCGNSQKQHPSHTDACIVPEAERLLRRINGE